MLLVGDPWELTSSGDRPAPLLILKRLSVSAEGKEQVLAVLNSPADWPTDAPSFVVIERRGGAELVADLLKGRAVECNLVGVPDEAAGGPPHGALIVGVGASRR